MNRTVLLLLVLALIPSAAFAAGLKYSITPGFFEENPGGKPIGPYHGGVILDKAGNIYSALLAECCPPG